MNNDTDELITIDLSTGQAVVIGPLGADVRTSALDFHPDGTLYGLINLGGVDSIVTINTNTGAATTVATLAPSLGGRGMAFRAGCESMMAVSRTGTGSTDLLTIDLAGTVSSVGVLPIDGVSLERSPLGYFTHNRANGFLTRVGVISGQTVNVFDLSPVLGPTRALAALAYSRMTGLLYSVDGETGNLIEIDPVFRAARVVGNLGSDGTIGGLAFEPF